MADTYTQLYVHYVFSTKARVPVLRKEHKDELHKYTAGLIARKGHKLLAINSLPDHMHIFVDLNPTVAPSDAVRDIKAMTSAFINKKGWVRGRFAWQEGFGAFSYAHSQKGLVMRYIARQEEHHQRKSYSEEYLDILKKFNIDYNHKFVLDDR